MTDLKELMEGLNPSQSIQNTTTKRYKFCSGDMINEISAANFFHAASIIYETCPKLRELTPTEISLTEI